MSQHQTYAERRRTMRTSCPVCGAEIGVQNRSTHLRRRHPDEAAAHLRPPGRPPGVVSTPRSAQFDPTGREQCSTCGLWYKQLGQHRRRVHGIYATPSREDMTLCPRCLMHPKAQRPDGTLRSACDGCDAARTQHRRRKGRGKRVKLSRACPACGAVLTTTLWSVHIRAKHPEEVGKIRRWTRRTPYPTPARAA